MSYQVPASYLQRLIEFIDEEYNIPRNSLLTQCEVTLEHSLDAKSYVDEEIFRRITALATQTIDDPLLGLKFGASLHIASHGPLGAAIMSCSNVADVFALINEFGEIRFPFRFELTNPNSNNKQKLTVLITYPEQYQTELELHCQICAAGTWSLISNLIGYPPPGLAVQFPFAENRMPRGYQELLPCPTSFDHKHFSFTAPTGLLDLAVPGKDEVSKELFISMCRRVRQDINSKSTVTQNDKQLSHAIAKLLGAYKGRYPCAPQVADLLGLSGRTLRQRLNNEGTSYRSLLNQHKVRQAKHLLINTNYSHDTIAEQLGYQDTANFSRAFKKETGLPPSKFRLQQSLPA